MEPGAPCKVCVVAAELIDGARPQVPDRVSNITQAQFDAYFQAGRPLIVTDMIQVRRCPTLSLEFPYITPKDLEIICLFVSLVLSVCTCIPL